MKKFLLILLLWPSLVLAGTSNITFQWDANTEPDLAGYRLYQSTSSGIYTFGQGSEITEILAGTTTVTVNSVPDGTYFWVLTAYDTEENESGPSNELTITLDATSPDAPNGLTITIIIKTS